MKVSLTKRLLAGIIIGIIFAGTVSAQNYENPTALQPVNSARLQPSYQPATPESYYAAQTVDLEARISSLESQLKKKQDKPDSKKGFTRVIDGRVFFDSYNAADQSGADAGSPANYSNVQNWVGVRDLRVGVKGEGFDIFDYKVDLSFVEGTGSPGNNSGVNFKDVWLGVKNVPLFEYVRIGHYRIEDGIANMTGGPNTTFFEWEGRDFTTARRIGISSRNLWMQDRLRLFTGIFLENDVVTNKRHDQQDNEGTITNFRLTYAPYISKGKDGKYDGRQFIMFGGSYSYFDVTETGGRAPVRFRSRFATLDIGNVYDITMDTSNYHRFSLEFAAQDGPVAIQSEIYANVYNNAAVNTGTNWSTRKDRTIAGGYLEARYFLTGDYRKFSPDAATWGGVDLKHNLSLKKVNDCNFAEWLGGWEVAAKWAYTDMSKLYVPGTGNVAGAVHDVTLGLNWYWSSQARWMIDYSHVIPGRNRDGQSRDHSDTDIFAVSFRYHF